MIRLTVPHTWRPALLLMVVSPLLAEGISGGTPLTSLITPGVFIPYATLLYGFPVLVIREVATRRGYGPLGLWCLGVLYALYNEGFLAETFFHPLDVPLDTFATYGLVGGVRLPFVLWIGIWHGLFSVLAPVVFVEYLFPRQADRVWLPKGMTWALAAATAGLAVAQFLFLGDASRTFDRVALVARFAFLIVTGLGLWLAASRLPRTPRVVAGSSDHYAGWQPFFLGAALYLPASVVPEVLAQGGVAWPLFVLYFAAFVGVVGWAVGRRRRATRQQVVLFLLGSGTAQGALAILLGALIGDVLWAVTGALLTAIFIWAALRVRRRAAVQQDGRPHGRRAVGS